MTSGLTSSRTSDDAGAGWQREHADRDSASTLRATDPKSSEGQPGANMKGTVNGVAVEVDVNDPGALRAHFSVGETRESLELIRLPAKTQLYLWSNAWTDPFDLRPCLETGVFSAAQFAALVDSWEAERGQAGLTLLQHPFIDESRKPALWVVTLQKELTLIVDTHDLALGDAMHMGDESSPASGKLDSLAALSTAPQRFEWVGKLAQLGVDGIYRRDGVARIDAGADGSVTLTNPAASWQLHQVDKQGMLELMRESRWLEAGQQARDQTLPKVYAAMRCVDAGATREEVVAHLKGSDWYWLRRALSPAAGHRYRVLEDAIFETLRRESPKLASLSAEKGFNRKLCEDLWYLCRDVHLSSLKIALDVTDSLCGPPPADFFRVEPTELEFWNAD